MTERAGAVDFAHLEAYVGGDRAIAREVLALFSDQARTVLRTLSPTASDDEWRNAAHSLKGSALGIGAFDLAQACSEAELARSESAEAKRACLSKIADALGQALTDIAVYMRG
jgi:HPt (histidine-containing phosphotransfer) domain-containing protein